MMSMPLLQFISIAISQQDSLCLTHQSTLVPLSNLFRHAILDNEASLYSLDVKGCHWAGSKNWSPGGERFVDHKERQVIMMCHALLIIDNKNRPDGKEEA